MSKNRDSTGRQAAVLYCIFIVVFLGLAITVFFLFGQYACAAVSFGLPAIALTYGLSCRKGQIDALITGDRHTNEVSVNKSQQSNKIV